MTNWLEMSVVSTFLRHRKLYFASLSNSFFTKYSQHYLIRLKNTQTFCYEFGRAYN